MHNRLSVNNLNFSYNRSPFLKNVAAELKPGRILWVKGDNGAGKSTLIKMLAGLLTPQTGTISVSGFTSLEPGYKHQIEYLPSEGNGLFSRLSAYDNLNFWCKIKGISLSNEDFKNALSQWGLSHPIIFAGFPIAKFSTGMKRKLALVRATLSPSPLWLLDEPVSGLDLPSLQIFRDQCGNHLKRRGSIVIISHDPAALEGLEEKTEELWL